MSRALFSRRNTNNQHSLDSQPLADRAINTRVVAVSFEIFSNVEAHTHQIHNAELSGDINLCVEIFENTTKPKTASIVNFPQRPRSFLPFSSIIIVPKLEISGHAVGDLPFTVEIMDTRKNDVKVDATTVLRSSNLGYGLKTASQLVYTLRA